jgi:diaminopimelate epimerase
LIKSNKSLKRKIMQISKYNASGNDFIIFHTFIKKPRNNLAKKLCHRQKGIGADGLIVIIPHDTYDFEWQFYNSDGSDAQMCGNGSRAAAHYAYINGLCSAKMEFLTVAGVIEASIDKNLSEIKFTKPKTIQTDIKEEGFKWNFYDTGVPHIVTFVDDLNSYDKNIARKIRQKFNTNVNFAKLEGDDIHVRTYERGVEDETLACGTGMAACFYDAHLRGDIKTKAKVYPTSKEKLELSIVEGEIYFKGEVEKIFDTTIDE